MTTTPLRAVRRVRKGYKEAKRRWGEGEPRDPKTNMLTLQMQPLDPERMCTFSVMAPGGSPSDFRNLGSRLAHSPRGRLGEDKHPGEASNRCIVSGGLQ